MYKREVQPIPVTRREKQAADRAYFADRIELLVRLKRLRTKRMKAEEAVVEQLVLFPSDWKELTPRRREHVIESLSRDSALVTMAARSKCSSHGRSRESPHDLAL